jgi:hypothetical protein
MSIRNKIQQSGNYLVLTVVILVLSSWSISFRLHDGKKALSELFEKSEAAVFTPVAYIIQLSDDNATLAADYDDIARKNIFGIAWRGAAADNLKFAKQMGYHNVMHRPGMQNLEDAKDIHFMLEKPENLMYSHLGVTLAIRYATTYTAAQKNTYAEYFCLKNTTEPFPDNIANGWFNFNSSGKPTQFAARPDWQQQRVVDLALDLTLLEAQNLERPEKGFLFGGLAWDEGRLTGDFSSDSAAFKQGKNTSVSLAFWTGGDSSRIHPGTTHEYTFQSDGKAEFYKGLKTRLKEKYPGRKLIYLWEPYNINTENLHQVLERPDRDELLEDLMLVSEGSNAFAITKFADDASLFASGIIKRDWVGSTQPNEHGFDKIKMIVGKAGIHGSWFGWFGRFNGDVDRIDHIYQVPNWHQLARVIPSWDNLCGVPLNERTYNGSEYRSSNSCMSDKVLYSRQHKTNKLFVVFMDPTASIPLKPGDQVLSVKRVNNFFIETTDAASELNISDNMISLATTSARPSNANSFSIYPNPAKNNVTLKLANGQKEYSYQIIDMNGKQVKTGLIRSSESNIPIEKLRSGSYFIRLEEGGKLLESVRFVKE